MSRSPPIHTLFPYTTLFRSLASWQARAAAPPTPPGQWVVVVAPAFRAAAEPLCAQRRAQGLRVVVVPTTDVLTPAEVRRSEEHTSELQSRQYLVCRLLLEKK